MSKVVKRKQAISTSSLKHKVGGKKPSVFERLGIKTGSAKSLKTEAFCHHWAQSGSCPYGKGCKYSSTHTLISPSKQRAAKGQTIGKRSHGKEVHQRATTSEAQQWDQWDPDDLEEADADALERRRQELQRELELQMKMEHKAKRTKKGKKDTSPSSESSSSSTDSSSSSEDSSSSNSSVDAKHKKLKKLKTKRSSSTSSEERTHKHKPKAKRVLKSTVREKSKKVKTVVVKPKSPSPARPTKRSETPPLKLKVTVKRDTPEIKSPRPLSRASDSKKYRTPSPKPRSKDHDKEREREREKEREREREKERDREREREREREKERERERARQKEKEREREKEKKREPPRSPPRRNKTPERKRSPVRSRSRGKRDHKSPVREDKRRDDRPRSRGKDNRPPLDKNRKDNKRAESRDKGESQRDRERRIAREREAAREKEREEALAKERQRERERQEKKKEDERRGARDNRNRRDKSAERMISEDRRHHSTDRDRGERRDARDTRDRPPIDRNLRKSPDRRERMDRDMHERSFERPHERSFDREVRDRDFIPIIPARIRDERRLEDHHGSPFERNRHEDRRFIEDRYEGPPRDDRMPPMEGREYVDDRRTMPRREMWDEREMEHRGPRFAREGPPGPKGRDWVEPEFNELEWDSRGRRPPMEWENREGWDSIEHGKLDESWGHYDHGRENTWKPNQGRRWNDRGRGGKWSRPPRDVAPGPREHIAPPLHTATFEQPPNEDSNHSEPKRKEKKETTPTPKQEPPVEVKPVVEPEEAEKEAVQAPKRPADESLDGASDAKKPYIAPPEVLEDDLSEISDDADEILNRDEGLLEEPVEEVPVAEPAEPEPIQEAHTPAATSQKSQSPPRSPVKSVQKDGSIDDENMELDFEEISEDELEEESRIKGIGDALGVDWASLIAESRPRTKPVSSAKLRWEPHNILVNIGVSVRLVGEETVKEILKEHAEAELREQKEEPLQKETRLIEEKVTVKQEPQEVNINGVKQEIKQEPADRPIKEEPKDVVLKEEPKVDPDDLNISHPIAAIQVANQENAQIRKTLFSSVGPHRRALSARRDLTIRRHMCNLPLNDGYVEAPKRHDPELLKIATQLFERCL